MRILVTGSRSWTDRRAIATRIEQLATDAFPGGVLVLHGDADGADRIARDAVRAWKADGWPIDEHAVPANWSARCRDTCKPGHRKSRNSGYTYCPMAGMYRNADMVNLGADVCLAFIRDASRGATGCADLAEAAGIPTLRITWEER